MRSLTGRWSLVADIWTVSWRDTPATTTPTGRIGGSPFVRLSSVGPIHRLPYRARSPADKSWPGSTSTWRRELAAGEAVFTIARNPQEDTKLPYLLRLPIEGGLVLKARDTWPRSARIYCHPYEADWPDVAEIVEQARVSFIRRRGPVIDLVLDRPRLARSQFVFTETRGRPAIFWQTQKAARAANPGARIPRARAIPDGFTILIDSRERYPYRFTGRDVEIERVAL